MELGDVVPSGDFLADVVSEAMAFEGPSGTATMQAIWERAETLYFFGSNEDAILAIREAMESETRADHEDGDLMIDLRGRLAFCLSDTHQHDESIATWEELIPVLDARFGRDHHEALGRRMGHGECLDASRRYGEAIECSEMSSIGYATSSGMRTRTRETPPTCSPESSELRTSLTPELWGTRARTRTTMNPRM